MDRHHPAWRIQTSLSPSDSIDLASSDLAVEIFKWVGEEFGIIVDDETSRPKRKTDEKPPISPPKAKRSRNSTGSKRSSKPVEDEKDKTRKNIKNDSGKSAKAKEEIEGLDENPKGRGSVDKGTEDTKDIMVTGKGKGKAGAHISSRLTERHTTERGIYFNTCYIDRYLICFYLVVHDPDVILNNEDIPVDKKSQDQPSDDIEVKGE